MNDYAMSQLIISAFFGPDFYLLSGGVIAFILFLLLAISFRQFLPGVKTP